MRLSEAIRLGIGAVDENRILFLSMEGYNGVQGPCGCAIGTGLFAVGFRQLREVHANGVNVCIKVWPWTGSDDVALTLSSRHCHGESREQLADWIEQLENERGITDGQALFADGTKPAVVEPVPAENTVTVAA